MAESSRFQLSLSPQGATALRILKDSEIPLCGLDVVSASDGTIVKGRLAFGHLRTAGKTGHDRGVIRGFFVTS